MTKRKTYFYLIFLITGIIFMFSGISGFATERQSETAIYLSGTGGSDSNDGMSDKKPVRTFKKAKELAQKNQNIKKILVTGRVTLEDEDVSLKGTNAVIERDKSCDDTLFDAYGKVNFSDITIDGNKEAVINKEDAGGILSTRKGSTINVGENSRFINNNAAGKGAGIYAINSSINIYGNAEFSNLETSKAGPVIIAVNSSINIKGDAKFRDNYAARGGGVLFAEGSTVNIEGNAQFINNKTSKAGGVICLTNTVLNIKGNAKLNNNHANNAGVIFGNYSKVYIKDNAELNNNDSGKFSGGAIELSYSILDIKDNVKINGNKTGRSGGAIRMSIDKLIINTVGSIVDPPGRVPQEKGPLVKISDNVQINDNYSKVIGGAIDISNGTLDISGGHINNNKSNLYGGAIYGSSVTLNISGGEIAGNSLNTDYETGKTDEEICNDSQKSIKKLQGGAIFAYNSNIKMDGVTIENNKAYYGGGIALYNSNLDMKGGSVKGNTAYTTYRCAGFGGGIYVFNHVKNPSTAEKYRFNLSGGEISGNKANWGGGISLGDEDDLIAVAHMNTEVRLDMKGGTISDNEAEINGGGIFIQSGHAEKNDNVKTLAVADISGGKITKNKLKTANEFGGAGIFVNGHPETVPSHQKIKFINGLLNLKNVVITDNAGGGIASYPTSKLDIYSRNGAAIYSNNKDQIYLYSSKDLGEDHNGEMNHFISPVMLGDIPYNWNEKEIGEIPLNRLAGTLNIPEKQKEMKWYMDTKAVPDINTYKKAKVSITENYSGTNGGGIGSKGTVVIGEKNPFDLKVTKKWENVKDDKKLPKSVRVNVYRKSSEDKKDNDSVYMGYELIKPDSDKKWETVIKTLPNPGEKYIYTIKEKKISGYNSTVSGNHNEGFVITNKKDDGKTSEKDDGRISGKDRVGTSTSVSRHLYGNGANAVIIANKEKFPDVLTAVPFSVQINAPILFTDKDTLPGETEEEIRRLDPSTIYLNGGEDSISRNIEKHLKDRYKNVHRFNGKDRYETAVLIGEKIREKGNRNVIELASGEIFPDALSISSLAVKENAPILLSKKNDLTDYTRDSVQKWNVEKVTIAGQTGTISEGVEKQIKKGFKINSASYNGAKDVLRLGGRDRFETSSVIAGYTLPDSKLGVYASGDIFADSLIAGPYAARYKAPVLLVKKNSLPQCIATYTKNSKIKEARVIGGTVTVQNSVYNMILDIIKNK